MFKPFSAALLACSLASPVMADEITDTLQSAIEAYEDGDIQYALEELEYAKQQLAALKTDALTAFLPEPPDGWTREVSTDYAAGMAMLGGGVGAEAVYSNGSESITITIMADSPMVMAMAGMVSNAAAIGATIERVGREKFMNQDGDLTGMIDSRIMVQSSGGDVETQIMLLELIDFRELGNFGR